MGIWYTTRETVKGALDIKETARNNPQLDRCIEAASRQVEGLLRRKFYPLVATRTFSWPVRDSSSWKLYLGEHELVSVTTFTSGGVALTPSEYFLEPNNSGPPYRWIEINQDSPGSFTSGATPQRSLVIAGVWGYDLTEPLIGTAIEALDASETFFDVNGAASAAVGVGSVLRVDSERMVVNGRQYMNTGQDTAATLASSNAAQALVVADGTLFAAGETLLVDTEKLLVQEIAGNTLLVKRAHDGSTLAAHNSGVDIYAPRMLMVIRGALGTTAATHADAAPLYVWQVPGLVAELALAYALTNLGQQQSGYARTVGSGESEREASGRGLRQLEDSARRDCGRTIICEAV